MELKQDRVGFVCHGAGSRAWTQHVVASLLSFCSMVASWYLHGMHVSSHQYRVSLVNSFLNASFGNFGHSLGILGHYPANPGLQSLSGSKITDYWR